ncbi:hypothetical protein chiPu_0031195, partial [Chiloscyllium punctatum]|nr:hypothetical protein [Chiloscyllium punctatum]
MPALQRYTPGSLSVTVRKWSWLEAPWAVMLSRCRYSGWTCARPELSSPWSICASVRLGSRWADQERRYRVSGPACTAIAWQLSVAGEPSRALTRSGVFTDTTRALGVCSRSRCWGGAG